MECESERELVEYVRKASPPPFLLKTYMMVEDPASDAVISWNDGGTAFVVWQPAEFAKDLLPTLFKHSNFSSFVRQLNTYGFHKVATNRWEFSNERFRKGERDQLCEIRRRKATSNKQQRNVQLVQAATSDHSDNEELSTSSSEITNLTDENKRLKRENDALNSELLLLKRKCQQLVDLVAVSGDAQKRPRPLQLREDGGQALKLFGVRLEVGSERVVSQFCKII
ncbi:heat stress transcription factor B-3-like [Salvia miltiorrhiza]|uniref:heat stress transcription factor B-3-like n=1 Tax=Salvia miltiorrhiza TaxID=226208 RepID=UPI0025AD41D7|nr:heat stress transcription factor B-3-like [Salvia miltiorrhiza]